MGSKRAICLQGGNCKVMDDNWFHFFHFDTYFFTVKFYNALNPTSTAQCFTHSCKILGKDVFFLKFTVCLLSSLWDEFESNPTTSGHLDLIPIHTNVAYKKPYVSRILCSNLKRM